MYIKQIIIQGFKSYKDQTVIEPFSPKHNVIVGRNGSGKSNFFAAIRFVLSDAYTQMGREERQALLHEGSGSAVMSAYVEVLFDNSDERFPTGKDELVLRRTIGLKKDEYSLDRKNATKADVMSLLESAGFSRSNPYYIVPQGRVTALTNMKDPERLNLLKEVAGTQVYEARRSESIRIMADTDSKRAKIDDLLKTINERLAELEEEKKELKEYQKSDSEKRCLEYTIYHREQDELMRNLDETDEQRDASAEHNQESDEKFLDAEREKESIGNNLRALRQRMDLLRIDRKQYEDERRQLARTHAKLELEVKNTSEGQEAAQSSRKLHETNLREVQTTIRRREQDLLKMTPQYDDAVAKESATRRQVEEAESARARLFAKQGRNAQFRSKNERDAWLQNESSEVNVALATRKAVLMQTTEELEGLEVEAKQLRQIIAQSREKLERRGESSSTMAAAVQEAKEVRNRLQDQRKELWREEAKLDTIIKNTRDELDRSERFLSHMMDQNTSRGISAVRRISRQRNMIGVYGTLAELFEVPDRYRTATEITAGNSLFHYVVDTDDTATQLLEVLQKERAGRVTFMPLNRLHPRPANMPKSIDAIELVSKLNFDPMYEKAFQQVFGKTVICPNLQVASQYARSHGVNAITPEGDRSDKKGALSGGYIDPRQSRIEAVQALFKLRGEEETHRARTAELRRDIEALDQEISRAVGELQKAEQRRIQSENSYEPLQQELRSKLLDLQSKEDGIGKKSKSKVQIESNIGELGAQQSAYESELSSAFKKNLTSDEERQLEGLNSSIPSLRKQLLTLSNTRSDLEAQKSTIEVELRENLMPGLDQLKSQRSEDAADSGSRLRERQSELENIVEALAAADLQVKELENTLEQATTEVANLEQALASQTTALEELAKTMEKARRQSNKRASKRAFILEKVAEVSRNIRDLGVLPEDAFTAYNSMSSSKALQKLHAVNEVLKTYVNVNKKAFEQYHNFTKQREALTKRRSELDTSQNSIRELIDVLDQRKDEAIERTFKQVSKEFASIFVKLVPAGRGRLIIQRKSDRTATAAAQPEDDDTSDAEAARDTVENYTGVGISVSFNSKHDEQQRIAQLSGGQKSLCALALVFAIQQCDPAPFYLFDEIDANLDAQYRTAVAALLKEISVDGQFICTTFRPEMVLVAEKCYGVAYSNKTSSIDVVNREEALQFVEGQVSGA